jgi:hypothetical protein
MTALFTPNQMNELKEDRYKVHAKKMAERLEPFVAVAVKFYAEQMRPASQRILDDLKYSDWAYAFEFNSYDFRNIPGGGHAVPQEQVDRDLKHYFSYYDLISASDPCGTIFGGHDTKEMMWSIWRWTDFRTRLLAELGLDPEHFDFKNLAGVVSGDPRLFKDDLITEYRNKVHIVYKQFPKKN